MVERSDEKYSYQEDYSSGLKSTRFRFESSLFDLG